MRIPFDPSIIGDFAFCFEESFGEILDWDDAQKRVASDDREADRIVVRFRDVRMTYRAFAAMYLNDINRNGDA